MSGVRARQWTSPGTHTAAAVVDLSAEPPQQMGFRLAPPLETCLTARHTCRAKERPSRHTTHITITTTNTTTTTAPLWLVALPLLGMSGTCLALLAAEGPAAVVARQRIPALLRLPVADLPPPV